VIGIVVFAVRTGGAEFGSNSLTLELIKSVHIFALFS